MDARGTVGRRTLAACVAGLLAIAAAAGVVSANMANPTSPGDATGEPQGDVARMAILSEHLTLDLRPFAERNGRAMVTADYRIRNDGPAADLRLAFASPSLSNGTVSIDGRAVPSAPVSLPSGPIWTPPTSVPRIGGGTLSYFVAGGPTISAAIQFTLPVTTGEHDVRVAYAAFPGGYNGPGPYRDFTVGYTLAPARAWGSFGTLELTVITPPGWEIATSLSLARSGDTLTGTFQGVPADTFGLSTRPSLTDSGLLRIVGLGIGGVVAGLAGLVVARSRVRRRFGAERGTSILAGGLVGAALMGVIAVGINTIANPSSVPEWLHVTGYQQAFGGVTEAFQWGGLGLGIGSVAGFVGGLLGATLLTGRIPPRPPEQPPPPGQRTTYWR